MLIDFRERGREGEREGKIIIDVREKHRLVAFHMCLYRGPNPQPRHVPLLGIKPVTFQFVGQCPTN